MSQYFLDPSLFGYESFNTDGLSVSPSGGVYFKQHDLLTTPKNTISVGLFFVDPKDSLTKNKWRTSYSQSIDDAIPYDATTIKTGLHLSPSEACSSGWNSMKATAYNGLLKDDTGRFNSARGLCEIYDNSGYLVTNFAIRTGLGAPYPGTHIFTNDDGRQMLFEKSDTTPGSFFTKAQVGMALTPEPSAVGLFSAIMGGNAGWSMIYAGSSLAFDTQGRLTRLAESATNSVGLSYSPIPTNDASANAYYASLGLKPTTLVSLQSAGVDSSGQPSTEQLQMLRSKDNRILKVQSLEPPVVYPQQVAFNSIVDGQKQQDIDKIFFHYNAQGLADLVSPSASPQNISMFAMQYDSKNRLLYNSNMLETLALTYDSGEVPLYLQTLSQDRRLQYQISASSLNIIDVKTQQIEQAYSYALINQQQKLVSQTLNTDTGETVTYDISYDGQGNPTVSSVISPVIQVIPVIPVPPVVIDAAPMLLAQPNSFPSQDLATINPYYKLPESVAIRQAIANNTPNPPNNYPVHFNCDGYLESNFLKYSLNAGVVAQMYDATNISNLMSRCAASQGRFNLYTSSTDFFTSFFNNYPYPDINSSVNATFSLSSLDAKLFPRTQNIQQSVDTNTWNTYTTWDDECGFYQWEWTCSKHNVQSHNTEIYLNLDSQASLLFDTGSFPESNLDTNFVNNYYVSNRVSPVPSPLPATDTSLQAEFDRRRRDGIFYPPFQTFIKEAKYVVCANGNTGVLKNTASPCSYDAWKFLDKAIKFCDDDTYT